MRTLLRRILSTYTNKPPEELSFECTSVGKPYLTPPNSAVQFNVSHSDSVALIAVSNGAAVGIDVESRRRVLRHASRFAKRWFTPAELCQLDSLSDTNLFRESLLEAWTRKEAFVKCTGEGIARDLRSIQVSIGPQDDCKLLTVDDSRQKASNWYMKSLHGSVGEHDVLSTLVVAAPESDVDLRIIDMDNYING